MSEVQVSEDPKIDHPVDSLIAASPADETGSNKTLNDEDGQRRTRTLTTKGKQFKLETAANFMKSCKKRLVKQIGIIDTLLTGFNNDLVNNEMTSLEKTYGEFTDSYAQACGTVGEEEGDEGITKELLKEINAISEATDNLYLECKEKVCSWAIEQEKAPNVLAKSTRSGSSHSQSSKRSSKRSSRSGSSRSSNPSVRQKAKVAQLKAEAESLKKVREAELSAELSRLDLEIKKAEAVEKVYLEEETKITGMKEDMATDTILPKESEPSAELSDNPKLEHPAEANLNSSKPRPAAPLKTEHTSTTKPKLNPPGKLILKAVPPVASDKSAADVFQAQLESHNALLNVIKSQSAPKPDLDSFDGDPLEYLYFRANFKEVVESAISDERGRLTRLIKYTKGDAKELIKHLIHADSTECYTTALALLDKEYGNPHLISCSYLKQLRQWKTVKEDDAPGFKKMYRFLLKCQTYKSTGRLKELDSTDMIKLILSKLHISHQKRWTRRAVEIRRKHDHEANFDDLVTFMESEAEVLSDPAYSREAFVEIKVNATQLRPQKTLTFVECPICNQEHDIEDCDNFLQMNIDERHRTVFHAGLCFSCLGPASDSHNGKNCSSKRKCRVCNEDHPTTLHGGKGTKSNYTATEDDVISQCVVPVHVWHEDFPDKKVAVYALVDDCCTGTFITDEALDMLRIPTVDPTIVSVTTLNGKAQDESTPVTKLKVKALPFHTAKYPSDEINLPRLFSRSFLAVEKEEIPTPSSIKKWPHLDPLQDKLMEYDPSIPIGLMIGGNCPKALEPVEVIESVGDGPFAKRTRLGWCVVGAMGAGRGDRSENIDCNFTRISIPVKDISKDTIAKHCFTLTNNAQDTAITNMLQEMYQTEFNETNGEKRALSHEDERFLETMASGASKENGKHVLPLPFRNPDVTFPCNKQDVLRRLVGSVKKRLSRDSKRHEAYSKMMEWIITNFAQKVDINKDRPGKSWYIPHHGIYNASKDKFRVVFDASAKFKGRSLNEELLQGPDLSNLLTGVLVRFRKEDVAIMADIEAMFYQVVVPESQRSFFRFLWWKDGNLDGEIEEYEMSVHVFGAVSSGGCANYALKKTAREGEAQFGVEAAQTVQRDFYVDDWLKSVEDVPHAVTLVSNVRNMCASTGFNLNKFISNSREVIESVPIDKRAASVVSLDLTSELPIERALGMLWCIEDDTLGFRIVLKDSPLSRKGILGTISSIFDPHGIAGPFILPGRKVLQNITQRGGSWDDEVPEDLRSSWEKWRTEILLLQDLKIPRCYKPKGFKPVSSSLHCFSDASDYGYGMAAYLRQTNKDGEVCVSLVMAKSRVVPTNAPTTPRLELAAALVSAKVGALLLDELDIEQLTGRFWVDSTIVLGYIQNDTKRFKTYVANRGRKIRNCSKAWNKTANELWTYVTTDDNPADDASRGLSVHDKEKVTRWFGGPAFLKDLDDAELAKVFLASVAEDDPEIIVELKSNVAKPRCEENAILSHMSTHISNWMRMKRVLATVISFTKISRSRKEKGSPMMVEDILEAEILLMKMVQAKHFPDELKALEEKKSIKKCSSLRALDPFLDQNGVMRVGGRLAKSLLPADVKHPTILPKKEVVVSRLIEWHHKRIKHLGRTSTLGEVRSCGYWLINGNEQVRRVVGKCVPCKALRGVPVEQKMSDLPETRSSTAPPFTYCGADACGPFVIKEGRKELKRYCILFTCFSCRAIHLEVVTSMDTDAFLLALRRFLGRRGPVRSIRSDNGGNFVGADNEMRKAMKEMDHVKIKDSLQEDGCDWEWVNWERNPAVASHFGGVWERQIRSVRSVLSVLLKEHAGRLNDESLRTLFVEVESIVNSRPLSADVLSDSSIEPLTPNHLLTMKTKVILPPPGEFQRADVYCRKRWRAVQYLANEFWSRWRKEFLLTLQQRHKWNDIRPNLEVGDVVLVVESDCPRNQWSMGRIVEATPSDDGMVRKVAIKVSGSDAPLSRPVAKTVLLLKGGSEA